MKIDPNTETFLNGRKRSVARRGAVARLTREYPNLLRMLFEKTVDKTTREPLTPERHRACIIFTAGQYFRALIGGLAKLEPPHPKDKGLNGFHEQMAARNTAYREAHMGAMDSIGWDSTVQPGEYFRVLTAYEEKISMALVIGAKIEITTDPDGFNLVDFYVEAFRGFADADPSGAILEAASNILLDHIDDFKKAVYYHEGNTVH